MADDCDKSLRGSASQFYVAAELCRRGWAAAITLGNCPNTDILCGDPQSGRSVQVQVKTFPLGRHKCVVGLKAEANSSKSFFWILVGLPDPDSHERPVYYVIPSKHMAKHVKASNDLWLKGPDHDPTNRIRTVAIPPKRCRDGWDISRYKDKWDLIAARLSRS